MYHMKSKSCKALSHLAKVQSVALVFVEQVEQVEQALSSNTMDVVHLLDCSCAVDMLVSRRV